jgi:glycosyltransferase involved in cell wall biosynthesis
VTISSTRALADPDAIAAPSAAATGPRPEPAAGQPIRVLHVITRLIVGGAMENTLLTVIGQMRDPRYDVTLYSGIDNGPEGNLHAIAREQGVRLVLTPYLVRPIRPLTDLRALVELTRFIRRGRFHLVHTHATKAGILGRIAAKLAGTPIVVHTLHSLVFHEYQSGLANRTYVALKKLCAPLTDQFISVSEATARGAIRAGIGDPEKHAVVFSGMDLEPFLTAEARLDRAAARRRFGLPPEAPVVGKVARLFPLKGHAEFLAAAAAIHAARPDVHFLLVGDGVLRADLEAEVRRRGLDPVVHFAGLVPSTEIPAALLAMDVVVHTSLREGIARVLPQALAVGRPVVTFALDGAPEVVADGESGYVVPPIDTQALASRVVELLADPVRRAAMAARGREFVVREFPVERMVAKIDALYEPHLLRRGFLRPVAR